MKKIRVIHVVHNFLRGGIESFLYYTVKEQLLNPNLDVAILCCQSKDKVVNHRIEKLDVPIFYVEINPFELRMSHLKLAVSIVNDYDIVHLQSYQPTLSWWLALRSCAKIVSTVHSAGTILRGFSLKSMLKNYTYVKFLNRNDGVAHNSPFTKKFWNSKGLKERKTNVVVYNGVNFEDNYSVSNVYKEFPFLKDKVIVGTSSRLIAWKRVKILLETFAEISQNLPSNAILLIVGDGPELPKLKEISQKKKISDRVVFTGYRANITDYQAVMDICVFPSAEEPFGLVSIECLHLGKKVFVMHDGGGFVDIVGGCDASFVCGDADDLGNKIVASVADLREDNGSSSRIAYSQRYSVRQSANSYFLLYQEVLK